MDGVNMVVAANVDHETVGPWDVEVGATAEYGEYLAVRCANCHGVFGATGRNCTLREIRDFGIQFPQKLA